MLKESTWDCDGA